MCSWFNDYLCLLLCLQFTPQNCLLQRERGERERRERERKRERERRGVSDLLPNTSQDVRLSKDRCWDMALFVRHDAKKMSTWFVSVWWFWLVTWLNWEMWMANHGTTGHVPLTSKFFWNSSSRASSSFCCHFCQTTCPSSSLPSSPVPLSPFTPPSADCKRDKGSALAAPLHTQTLSHTNPTRSHAEISLGTRLLHINCHVIG